MQSKLEDVLREKERELKLHQRFLNLREFCEVQVFPFATVPLQRHVERLKTLVEMLLPEPKDRTEELFSGEIFVLLSTLYLHDIGVVSGYEWSANREIIDTIDSSPRTLFLNYEIARKLDVPERAIELVNSLIFAPVVKKIPVEWEIREETRRAIVRNARILEQLFSFSHLLWDVFSADAGYHSLRRFRSPDLRQRCGEAALSVDSREGRITIRCAPEAPYQSHVLERVREYVDNAFSTFRNCVNGRLGLHYREIVWDIAKDGRGEEAGIPSIFPFNVYGEMPFLRWEEAALLLDKLFRFGHVIVVGEAGVGKTTLISSFVVPQLRRISPNVFYAELWEKPVNEIRDAVEKSGRTGETNLDIISICNRLLTQGPCFFILDGCERLKHVDEGEKEKLERFIDFCLGREDVFLVVAGDKEEFFEWYRPFVSTSLSAVFEMAFPRQKTAGSADRGAGGGQIAPVEKLKEIIDQVREGVERDREFREIVSVLVGPGEKGLRRSTVSEIVFETRLPHDEVANCLGLLRDHGIVREERYGQAMYYVLSGRYLKEPLFGMLQLDEFQERWKLRDLLRQAARKGELLGAEALAMVDRLTGRIGFTGEEMAWVLASSIHQSRDVEQLLCWAGSEVRRVDYEPVLMLLACGGRNEKAGALRLLREIKDEGVVNPLLRHLRDEQDEEIRKLIVEGFVESGKRRALVALMGTLSEMGDRASKLHAVSRIAALPGATARKLLLSIADAEKDQDVLDAVDALLATLEESL